MASADDKDVITSMLLLLTSVPAAPQKGWPQAQPPQEKRAGQGSPNGAPQGEGAPAGPARRVRSDFDSEPPVRQVRRTPQGRGVTGQPAAKPGPEARPGSLLRPVFEAVGFPSEMRDLGGVIAKCQLSVFNHQGGVLADLSLRHLADLAAEPRRDRLEFNGRPSVSRVYGRNGRTVFAEMYGMAWQQLEKRAAEELEVFGLLLRFPWGFDPARFRMEPARTATVQGERLTRFRVLRRSNRPTDVLELRTETDVFDIYCDPRTMVPKMLQMTLEGGGGTVTVQFLDYFAVGSVSVPRRRIFLGPTGNKVMEVRMLEVLASQRLSPALFRPGR